MTFDALSSTNAGYLPDGWRDPNGGFAFGNDQEHFHTAIEDSQFGIGVLRQLRPFDFAGREGHIQFDVDLKTSARRYVRLMLSPALTKTLVDDRQDLARPCPALDIWFINGRVSGNRYGGAGEECTGSVYGNQFFPFSPTYTGKDNVRDTVDVYVTRTSVRVLISGTTYIDAAVQDLGFDRAYVYLAQVSYNPCKDDECAENLQTFHWDNVAWDGPVLPNNSLTPAGSQDVVFNVYGAASCTVKGVPATRVGPMQTFAWQTWSARMPVQPVTEADVQCSGDSASGWGVTGGRPRGFEVVTQ